VTQLNSFRKTVIYLRYVPYDNITHMMTITRRAPVELHIRMCLLGLLYQVIKRMLYLEISSIHQYVSDLISGTKPILDFHGVQYRCSLQKVLNKD